jgi:hypothetical protein
MNTLEAIREVFAERSQAFFYIHSDLTPNQVKRLIAFTQAEDDPIKLDGDEGRFMSLEQYLAWRQKGRTIYALTDNAGREGNLAGIFWAGQKPLPVRNDYTTPLNPELYTYTYAFRLYGPARGIGISQTVLKTCIDDYVERLTLPTGFWLEVSGLNPAALHMDQKMGYKIASGLNDQNRLVLARSYEP